MSKDSREMKARFGAALDGVADADTRGRTERASLAAADQQELKNFADRVVPSLQAAVDVVNERRARYGLKVPARIEVKGPTDNDPSRVWIDITVVPHQPIEFDPQVGWTLHVFRSMPSVHAPWEIRLEGRRHKLKHSWFKVAASDPMAPWSCAACDPTGLDLNTDGSEFAERFVRWFVEYAAPGFEAR